MYSMKVSEGGRVVIPAPVRRALDLHEGDVVVWDLQDGDVRLSTKRRQIEKARAIFQSAIPLGSAPNMLDELLQERRDEAMAERAEQ